MEKIKFDAQLMKILSLFESLTKASVRDCISGEDRTIFIVNPGEMFKAIGKNGVNVKRVENALKRKIKIVEYNSDTNKFIRNVVYPAKIKEITEDDGIYEITPFDSFNRGLLIGRNAVNLRKFELIIKRYFPIKELKVK